MISDFDLHSYQIEVVKKIKHMKKAALFLEMSLGKTVITLTALNDLILRGDIKKVLIIAPLRVANTVWKQETNNWEHLAPLRDKIAVCTGKPNDRIKAIQSNKPITIVNKDCLEWLTLFARKVKYDCIVIDESSGFKESRTKRFKAARWLCNRSNYTLLLTGTPSPNSLMDLWSQIFLLDQGQRLGRSKVQFKKRHFFKESDYTFNWILREGSEEIIRKSIEDICITLKTKDYVELPDKIISYKYCTLPTLVMADYKYMESDFLYEIKHRTESIEAVSAAAKTNKLLQMANGFIYDEEKNAHELHTRKIEVLKEIVENYPDENLLVAYNFKHDLEMLKREFPTAVVLDKTGTMLKDWNDGKIKMLLAHPASAGHGLNLQRGGSVLVWYSLTWSLENYQQFNARLHRQGQNKPVKIVHILAKNTHDERVVEVLNDKDVMQENLLQKLKLILKRAFL